MILFAMFGCIMFVSKLAMEGIPNVHPIAMFVMVLTISYGYRALVPIYVYVLLNGIYAGFAMWWIPYLYIWTVYWAVTMLIPKNISMKVKAVLYPALCALYGLMFGTLYAPAQALMFNFSLSTTLKWIIAGLPWDAVHAVGNLFMGLLVLPLSQLISKLQKKEIL